MQTINPFADPEFKKSILRGEGILDDDSKPVEEIEYEILGEDTTSISPDEGAEGFDSIISSAPKIPHTKEIQNIILDASQISKNRDEAKALEIRQSLNQVLTSYNKKYGLDLNIDLSNLSRTLVNVASPEKRRVLELYVSEVFKSMKPVIYLHLLSRLQLLIDYILDPAKLFSNGDLNTADLFVVVEKLLSYVQQISDMSEEISIKGSDLELQKIKDETGGTREMTDEEKQTIEDFMTLFKKDSGV